MKKSILSLALTVLVLLISNTIAGAAANPIPPASAPSNTVQSFGTPPASYLQAVKILQENKYGENEIKSFVYQIFSLFDRHSEVSQLLLLFADEDLDMRLPEGKLNSHNDFQKWYADIGTKYQSNTHTLERIDVQIPSKGDYRVDLTVHWQAIDINGKYVTLRTHQQWRIVDGGGYWPRIIYYNVQSAK